MKYYGARICIIISAICSFLAQVSLAQGLILLPEGTIRIITNTINSNGVFDYFITDTESPPNAIDSFETSTTNGTATNELSLVAFPNTYRLRQESVDIWQSTITCVSSSGDSHVGIGVNTATVDLHPFDTVTCIFANVELAARTPLLIVPGVLGTELKFEDALLWPNIPQMLTDIGDDFMDPLRFESGLIPQEANVSIGRVIEDPFSAFDYSAGLIKELVDQGYIENQDLFTFPYDWRYGVSGKGASGELVNVEALRAKIQSIREQTGSSKVDVVAHSTGGLVVKKYVMDTPDPHIGKVVFVGVPNTGAPKAVKVLLSGDNFGVPWLADSEMKKISQNLPVVYDLAPSRTYVSEKGSFFRSIQQKALAKDTVEDLAYDPAWNVIINQRGMNQAALTNAENLHTAEFDNFDLRTKGVDFYNIVGCKAGTIGQVVERTNTTLFGNTIISYDQPKETPGDGTVPLESSTNVPVDSTNKFYSLKGEHGKMLSQDGVRQQIVNIVSGSSLNSPNITQDISKCKLKGKAHAIFSPLDIEVLDQAGNRLGFTTDGSLQNDIPGADFNVFGDHKFLFLPDDEGQTYSINLKGTGNATFTYKAQDIVNNEVVETEVFANVPVTTSLYGTVINNTGNAALVLDTNGDGSADKTLAPALLDAGQSQDVISPETSATVTGTQGQSGWYRSSVEVQLSAIDTAQLGVPAAGIFGTRYSIDGGQLTTYSQPISITTEGSHTVKFYSTDKAGNNEIEQTLQFTIDKTAPEVSMQFSITKKDLMFAAVESGVSVVDGDDAILLTDQAGNKTQVKLKERDRRKRLRAEVVGLAYNGQAQDIGKTILRYAWEYDKQGQLKALEQHIKSKKQFNIDAVFKPNQTKLSGKDHTGKINLTLPGATPLHVTTNTGDFTWAY